MKGLRRGLYYVIVLADNADEIPDNEGIETKDQ